MAYGLSPKLPLLKDPQDGYALNKTYLEMVKQNFKMLVLTSPGERIMYPTFGVGLRNFLFESADERTYDLIRERILQQTQKYMPFVEVNNILISDVVSGPGSVELTNSIDVKIEFFIKPLELAGSLEIKQSDN